MEKEQINQRTIDAIYYLLNNVKGLNKTSLAASLNVKPAKFSEILNLRMNAGVDIVSLLTSVYNISADWLLTGKGNMIKSTSNSDKEEPSPKAIHAAKAEEGIPLLPINAMAGALTSEQTVLDYECERYIIPMFKGADFLIPVKGSSMYPKYSSGDVVACQRVPMSGLFFQWNKVYVIDTQQGPLIKRIKPGSDNDHLLIVSDNEKYNPFELPIASINAVALVIGVIRLE